MTTVFVLNRSITFNWSLAVFFLTLVGCSKPSTNASANSSTSSASAQASVSIDTPKKVETQTSTRWVSTYNATLASVRIPSNAPKFVDQTEGMIGEGKLVLNILGNDGPIQGEASGALGTQKFSGFVQGNKLTGTLQPDAKSPVQMWGTLHADAEGSGPQRVFKGSLRASSSNGRVVRESTIEIKPESTIAPH